MKEIEELDSVHRTLMESKSKAELIIENLQANKKIDELEKREMAEKLRTEHIISLSLTAGLCATIFGLIVIGFFLWQKKKDNQNLACQNKLINRQKAELAEYQEKLEEIVVARTSKLLKLLDKSRESDRLKSSFFSNMSHEIRTPLNAIVSFSQMFDSNHISVEERETMINLVKSNANQLMKMFEDIITLSEIDSGVILIRPRKCDIREMLGNAVIEATEKMAAARKNKMEIILDDRLPETIDKAIIDGVKISRILTHLIDNAIKNTDSGYVMFGCEAFTETKTLHFWVEDTGTGIKKEEFELIFQRFWKHGEASTQEHRGLGIGLALCKELLDVMEGKISIASELGQGSTFSFTINYQ